MTTIEIKNVSKTYGKTVALKNVYNYIPSRQNLRFSWQKRSR